MIPQNTIGEYSITHEEGLCVLRKSGFIWMLDSEAEKATHQFAIDACDGVVLVGGLGLGYIVEQLAVKESVTDIIVIESSQEVIDLVWPHIDTKGKGQIIKADLFEYLNTFDGNIDYMYLDIHPDTSYRSLIRHIEPLRTLGERLISPDKVLMWQETKMRAKYG